MPTPDDDTLAAAVPISPSDPLWPVVVAHKAAPASKVFGFICLVGLIITWVGQSEVAQYVQTGQSYNKPMTIVWFNHSFSALLVPIQSLWYAGGRYRGAPGNRGGGWFKFLAIEHDLTPRVLFRLSGRLALVYSLADYFW